MSTPFIGEIRAFSFNFAPKGWALCDGQLLPINQNQALFSLLGTTFGGNGTTNFQLPNLQGRIAVGFNASATFGLGQTGGEETHVLALAELPAHTHAAQSDASAPADAYAPAAALPGIAAPAQIYSTGSASIVPMSAQMVASVGSSPAQAHENRQPFLVMNYSIALQGIFPSRN